jgi:uncharacterized protein (DUF305 family)
VNKKFLAHSLVGLLNSFIITGLVLTNNKQAQSLPASGNSQPARSVQVDKHFIEMMIPHHQDAIVMADLALSSGRRSEIKELAKSIKQAQTREIQQMRTWYKQWYGTAVPAHSMTDMGMMGDRHNQEQKIGSGMDSGSDIGSGSGMGMGQGMMNMKMDGKFSIKLNAVIHWQFQAPMPQFAIHNMSVLLSSCWAFYCNGPLC